MVWTGASCGKCRRRMNIRYDVVPPEAWRTVVLNRWRLLCPQCFDLEAQQAGVAYSFANLEAMSWSEQAPPRRRRK